MQKLQWALVAIILLQMFLLVQLAFQVQQLAADVEKSQHERTAQGERIDTVATRVSWLERGRLADQQRIKQIQDDATTLMKQAGRP